MHLGMVCRLPVRNRHSSVTSRVITPFHLSSCVSVNMPLELDAPPVWFTGYQGRVIFLGCTCTSKASGLIRRGMLFLFPRSSGSLRGRTECSGRLGPWRLGWPSSWSRGRLRARCSVLEAGPVGEPINALLMRLGGSDYVRAHLLEVPLVAQDDVVGVLVPEGT